MLIMLYRKTNSDPNKPRTGTPFFMINITKIVLYSYKTKNKTTCFTSLCSVHQAVVYNFQCVKSDLLRDLLKTQLVFL